MACEINEQDGKITCTRSTCTDFVVRPDDPDDPYACGLASCCSTQGSRNTFGPGDSSGEKEPARNSVTCSAEYAEDVTISLLCSLGLNADIYFASSVEESTAPGMRLQSFPTAKSAHKAKTQNNASHFQFMPGAVLQVDLDDEQVRTLSQILSSLTSKALESPLSMRLKQDASHQKGRLQSLDSQKQNNIRDPHRACADCCNMRSMTVAIRCLR